MMSDNFKKWSKENPSLGYTPTEPTKLEFATEPWEGQFSYTNAGEYVQYRNGTWVPARQAGC